MKRVFDLLIVLISLILLLPIFVISFTIIITQDGFPIFYIQKRVGLDGEVFNLYKFRSMKKNSDKFGSTTFRDDNRIFLGGGFLRRYKIDELPQLINILKGEMSIVGPRPTVLDDYNRMTKEQKKRNTAVPGLTGLAQISGNTFLSWPERIILDLQYIQRQSFIYDSKIIAKTIVMIFSNKIDSETNQGGEW